MHVVKGHLKPGLAGDGSAPTGKAEASRSSEEELPLPSVADAYIIMALEERNFIMTAAERPANLEDPVFMGNLELVLSKYKLTVPEFTKACQEGDATFFSRLHTVASSNPS